MNNYIYSPSQNIITPVMLKKYYVAAGTWPSDSVNISDETAFEFSQQYPAGKTMAHDDNNQPCWIDLPPPTKEELVVEAELQKQKLIEQTSDYINNKQWPGKAAIGRLSESELSQYNQWLDRLDALEDIDTASAPDITWPEPLGE